MVNQKGSFMFRGFVIALHSIFILASCTSQKQEVPPSTIHAVLEANIPHLDPIHSTNKYSSTINSNIFEGLYHYHYLKRPYTIEPQLADGMPEVSDDGLTYTIKLKKGVLFQDDEAFENGKGRELTAKDVIYSWKRLADPTNKALGWWVFDGLIEGLNKWRDDFRQGKSSYETPVAGLSATDSHTLQVKLTNKSYLLLHYLAMPVTMVVAHEVVKKYGQEIVNHPVGTGPYRLKSWIRNSEVHLVQHKNYRPVLYPSEGGGNPASQEFLKDAGQTLPLSKEIRVKIIAEKQPLWLSFMKGDLDFGSVPKENFDQVFDENTLSPEYEKKGIKILSQARPDVVFIAFNMEHPVLGKNKNLRMAMASAIDKKELLEKFYNDRGVIAQGPIPPGLDAYDESYKAPTSFDLEKAKDYLKLAGYPNGEGLPVFEYELPNASSYFRQLGEYFKDSWGKIGVKIKINTNTWPQFDKKIKTKRASLFDMAWMADYPDGENFLQIFYSKKVSPGPNNFNYMNREFDSIYKKAVELPKGEARNQLMRKLVEIVNEDVPAIFTVHRVARLPYQGWLENYYESPIVFDFYKYLKINGEKKKELMEKL